jgi:hypothetical protein
VGLVTLPPGRFGLAVRPYYEGPQVDLLDDGLDEGGRKPAGSGWARLILSRPGRTAPEREIVAVERRWARRSAWTAHARDGVTLYWRLAALHALDGRRLRGTSLDDFIRVAGAETRTHALERHHAERQ